LDGVLARITWGVGVALAELLDLVLDVVVVELEKGARVT